MAREQQGGPIPVNPKNYLRPGPRAKVIDLNKMMSTWGSAQAKYKEGDVFISKKILQNLDKAIDFASVISQEKFKKNLKTIMDITSGTKGEISYKFKEGEVYLAEEVLNQNYIHHYKDNVWKYYLEKNKNETENEEK
jgi:hypothetical protein